MSSTTSSAAAKNLTPAEWESLIDDFNHGGAYRINRHTGGAPPLDLAVTSLLRKDFPLQHKLLLLTSMEQIPHQNPQLPRLLEALRSIVQSPNDPFALKDQFLTSTTSIFITSLDLAIGGDGRGESLQLINGLVELLLTVINRPNHGLDRHTRGVACECLRQLEIEYPCLLSETIPHVWALCQSERTHVSQWYVLLLSTIVVDVVRLKPIDVSYLASIGNATGPLVPFSVPLYFGDECVVGDYVWKDKEASYKQLKRVVSFLLDCAQILTSFGLAELIRNVEILVEELELQGSLLRMQFSWLVYTFNPLLCHVFLGMYLRLLDERHNAFDVASRLLLLSKETHQNLVFRLLGLHWLLGLLVSVVDRDGEMNRRVVDMSLRFYPSIFDPLAIKSLKLDLLAYCLRLICNLRGDANDGKGHNKVSEVKLFEDGLVCVSSFKWLPPWSSEAAVAFRTFHKFLIGASPHSEADTHSISTLVDSNIVRTLEKMLVDSVLQFQGLVPMVVVCLDRLLGCEKHQMLGVHLLATLDKHLLPRLKIDYTLGSCFPIFQRMSENDKVSPDKLLELLTRFVIFLVEKHGPDTGLRSWHHGSKVLGICRTMLMHHSSSRIFNKLSRLLASTCLYFPDLEVRDNARFYLRLLICVPGTKLKSILNTEDNLHRTSAQTHPSPFFSSQSPRPLHGQRKPRSLTTYIHIERVIPLLVKESWSLSLPTLSSQKHGSFGGIEDMNEPSDENKDSDTTASLDISSGNQMLRQKKEPLCVMDAKISEVVRVIRQHFSLIPDYRHMPGIKIKISCTLRFDTEPFKDESDAMYDVENLPALYATVLNFTSSAPYGSIPSFHIPFLLGSSPKNEKPSSRADSLAIVPVEYGDEEEQDELFKERVSIELEPREPMPGLVDVVIEANADNDQIIRGPLKSICVGIEDMFLRAIVPDNITLDSVPSYYDELFNALWEACGSPSSYARETFVLKGGKGAAAINGTRSVKLLPIPATSLVRGVERHLAPFVVSVIGEPIIELIKHGGAIGDDVLWKGFGSDASLTVVSSPTGAQRGRPLYLKYVDDEDERGNEIQTPRKYMGYIHVLIFLPPRYHLLFQMEVRDFSTLVRIRTDHWPCLAYVDDYLEALFGN